MTHKIEKIAVIGAGTMGSGIAAQIANAGLPVLLLDLPAREGEDKTPAEKAIDRLLASDPPQLMHKSNASLISTGIIDEDMDKLAEMDWIIEAVIEQLPIKQRLYRQLAEVVHENTLITSNTSTIPIRLLVEGMADDFKRRFAITHYFNPVRYMRLLELVRGPETTDEVMDALDHMNDVVLGKGVVRCEDTPGFLGNRVGVYALQVGLHEALSMNLSIEDADALMGRPMGIPKTGIFGLYDLIGVDLMRDVVASLRQILPEGDAFHAVGHDPEILDEMIADGYTGQKGKGGFYRDAESGREARIFEGSGDGRSWRTATRMLPACAQAAADALARGDEPLTLLLADKGEHGLFARRTLVKILSYAASLLGEVTQSAQDIDDAMKLGFNWIRGPFELMDAIGAEKLAAMADEAGIELPEQIKSLPFYAVSASELLVRHSDGSQHPVKLADGVVRFHLTRQTMQPLASNPAASLFELDGGIRLIEFHSKANALTGQSMEIVAEAAANPGTGILVHNDAQHFSAGVDLNAFLAMIRAENWTGIDSFLNDFQQAVKALKYTNVPVVGAPSGLAVGGGYEVLAHCDKLVVHSNSILGLVESGVGLVPAGGGIKQTYLRWYEKLGDWNEAAWKAWMQLGYGLTGSSPQIASKLAYFNETRDSHVMNRDYLITQGCAAIAEMQEGYRAPATPDCQLADHSLIAKMADFMQAGIDRGDFFAHDKTVALAIASVMVADEGEGPETDEQGLYDRERRAFLRLAKTAPSKERITSLLEQGEAVRN